LVFRDFNAAQRERLSGIEPVPADDQPRNVGVDLGDVRDDVGNVAEFLAGFALHHRAVDQLGKE
jgi:hypothetical protein